MRAKKLMILYAVFVCCVQVAVGQSLHDGMYSKEWEAERERVANSNSIAIPDFYTPVNVDAVYRGMRIKRTPSTTPTPTSTTPTPTSTKARSKVINAQKKAQDDAEFKAQKAARIEAARDEARRKEQERKRRIAAENAADRRMGYARHMASMSGFYSSKYARDQYMMNEGARKLDETVRAMDFANVPEQKVEVMKGKELANVLREGRLITEKGRILKKDKQFDAGDQLDVTGNVEMDEELLEKWDRAKMENNIVDLEHKQKKTVAKQPELIVSKDELCLDSLDLFILPRFGLVMLVGDSMRVLKDYELRAVTWNDGKMYSYVVSCGKKLIGRDYRSIYDIKDAGSERILEFDTPNFSLFADSDSSVYSVFWYEDVSSIFRINVINRSYEEIARLPAFVWKVESNGKEAFVMIDNTIFVLERNGTPHMFYTSNEYINDVTLSPWGILIATDKEIIRVKSANECEVFCPVAAKRVWCDGKEVYIHSKEGNLLYIDNGSDYIKN